MIVVFIVVLVVFGPQKLPELARGLGKLMAEFRKASAERGTDSSTGEMTGDSVPGGSETGGAGSWACSAATAEAAAVSAAFLRSA